MNSATTRSNVARYHPGLIDISLNAYGWRGPWSRRRGFDSLVQMSTGIADAIWNRISLPSSSIMNGVSPARTQSARDPRHAALKADFIRGDKMRLIGMLDSPYVRRVAISLTQLNVPFVHEPLSVFRDYDAFAQINPVVKAPTLILDDGTVLMESSLILEHLELLVPPDRRLGPADVSAHARSQRLIALALTACDKSVQMVYERNLRPAEKQHEPWVDRVRGQMTSAYRLLDGELSTTTQWLFGTSMTQADITVAVAWCFTKQVLPAQVASTTYPRLEAHSRRAEATHAFKSVPFPGI